MEGTLEATQKSFISIQENTAGEKWQQRFKQLWPVYKPWYFAGGDAKRPSYAKCLKMYRKHMPELLPTYLHLTELAGGGDSEARFLAHYCPPAYLSGCTQAVWSGDFPALVRNYDYSAPRLEGTVLKSRWNSQTVIAMIDASWGVLDGMNESGLAVSLAFGGRVNTGDGFGVPIILRYILEFCTSTPEAVAVLKRVPSHMSYNITLVDRDQRFVTAYIAPDKPTVVRQNPVATNHQGKIEWARHAWATATLEREAEVQAVLTDRDDTVDGLLACFTRPPVFNTAYKRGFGTLYTAVYYPLSGAAHYLWPNQAWHLDMQQEFENSVVINYSNQPGSIHQVAWPG